MSGQKNPFVFIFSNRHSDGGLTCHEPGRVEEVGEPEGGVRVRHGGQTGVAAGGLHCRAIK